LPLILNEKSIIRQREVEREYRNNCCKKKRVK